MPQIGSVQMGKVGEAEMKAVIELDVPDWQIGQPVTVYFKDTMMKHGICEREHELIRCKDCCNYDNGKCYNKIEHPTKDIGYVDPDWFCADGERRTDDA